MRLTVTQIHAIKTATHAVLGEGAKVSLFGSRAEDARRGWDIDLYITGTNFSPPAKSIGSVNLANKFRCLRRVTVCVFL